MLKDLPINKSMLKDLKVGDSYRMRKNYLLGNILLINTTCLPYGFLVKYSVFIYQKTKLQNKKKPYKS